MKMTSKITINSNSISQKDYQVYTDIETGAIIAVDIEGIKKIEAEHTKHKLASNIPNSALVKAFTLRQNTTTKQYENHNKAKHTYKIKNLRFASSRVLWK